MTAAIETALHETFTHAVKMLSGTKSSNRKTKVLNQLAAAALQEQEGNPGAAQAIINSALPEAKRVKNDNSNKEETTHYNKNRAILHPSPQRDANNNNIISANTILRAVG